MNNKGIEHFTMMFRFIIVSFIAVVMFAGFVYVTGILNDTFVDIGHDTEGKMPTNLTYASEKTFGQMNSSIQALRLVAIAIIFSEIMLIFIFNAFQRVHPFMFIVWILLVFFAVMFSAPVSNAYEDLMRQGVYGGLLESFVGGTWFLLNLPIIVLIVGIAGGVLMFINIIRSSGETSL